ncbi:hypothetical protein [Mangrovimonas futianensis]|uniref:hypothetical protein n=1 Tax=Mangrovimonas futianensis TaxID=2895523 RepID=UPI001E30BF71|nr:hypothetical protein [Mangrovimonas futianensis]MCF1423166.1 hypothetical protein [Mangrovimonas futianensis]
MKLLIALSVILTFSSCNDKRNELESEYQKCINDKTFDRGILYPVETSEPDFVNSVSVFDSIQKFEYHLQKTGQLTEINKNAYLNLVSDIEQSEFLKTEFEEFNSIHYFIENNLMTNLFFEELFYDCAISSFKNQIHYQFILDTKDKVQLNSYPNREILTELIDKVEFDSDTQRLIVTYLIYSNLYWRYEME